MNFQTSNTQTEPIIIALQHHQYYDRNGDRVQSISNQNATNANDQQPRRISLPSKTGDVTLTTDHYEFTCIYPNCDKIFELTNDLYDHIRENHADEERKCPKPDCRKQFKCMASLVYHARRHTTAKPYVCPLPDCPFDTAAKGNLKSHLLSKQHKSVMTLPLLNTILSIDTVHARPETYLHPPRHKRIFKLGAANKNPESKLKHSPRKRESDDNQVLIHTIHDVPLPPAKKQRLSTTIISPTNLPPNLFNGNLAMNAIAMQQMHSPLAIQESQRTNMSFFPQNLQPMRIPYIQGAMTMAENSFSNIPTSLGQPTFDLFAQQSINTTEQTMQPMPPPLEFEHTMQQSIATISSLGNTSNHFSNVRPNHDEDNEKETKEPKRKSAADLIFEENGIKLEDDELGFDAI